MHDVGAMFTCPFVLADLYCDSHCGAKQQHCDRLPNELASGRRHSGARCRAATLPEQGRAVTLAYQISYRWWHASSVPWLAHLRAHDLSVYPRTRTLDWVAANTKPVQPNSTARAQDGERTQVSDAMSGLECTQTHIKP